MTEPSPPGASKGLLAIVIVNWNGGDFTRRCLGSLSVSSRTPDRIIVVDNASTDRSLEGLDTLVPGAVFELIRNPANLGFARAANVGMRRAMERGDDFVFLLNNDAILSRDHLDRLLAAAVRHPEAGLLAGKILTGDGKRIWCAGAETGFYPNLVWMRGFGRRDDGRFDREERVEVLTGCGLLVTRQAIEAAGYLDEDFFVYVEDIDWSRRVNARGLCCLYVPDAVMYHDASASSEHGYGAWRKHMVAYNLVLFLRKQGRARDWLAFLVFEILLWPLLLLTALVRGRTRAVLAKARGTWRALLGRPFETAAPQGAAP